MYRACQTQPLENASYCAVDPLQCNLWRLAIILLFLLIIACPICVQLYVVLLIFLFCSGEKSWRQRALIAIVNVVLMDLRLEPGDFDPFCSRTTIQKMDNDDIRLLTVVMSVSIEFDEDNRLVSILLLQVWQPCLHLWRPPQPLLSTRSSFTLTFTFTFTCGGLVSPCPPDHLSL